MDGIKNWIPITDNENLRRTYLSGANDVEWLTVNLSSNNMELGLNRFLRRMISIETNDIFSIEIWQANGKNYWFIAFIANESAINMI